MSNLFPGDKLFQLKATHGLPLDVSLNEIIVKRKLRIDWIDFITAARLDGRWDFQTLPDIETGLLDAGVDRDDVEAVMERCKQWVITNPHPGVL